VPKLLNQWAGTHPRSCGPGLPPLSPQESGGFHFRRWPCGCPCRVGPRQGGGVP